MRTYHHRGYVITKAGKTIGRYVPGQGVVNRIDYFWTAVSPEGEAITDKKNNTLKGVKAAVDKLLD